MSATGDSLLDLLPAIYRLRDAEVARSLELLTTADAAELAGLELLLSPTPEQFARLQALHDKLKRGPLGSLLAVIAEQVAALEENLDQLYDDQFIETAAEWATPYIGDLIGYRPLHGVIPRLTSPRAEVAHTISYRRRKGTASMLEQLARDVTGWPARAVEFFQQLGWTQHMNHVRSDAHYAPDLRRSQQLLWQGTAFDTSLHTIDVRRAQAGGRFNIPHVGLFLTRLGAYSRTRSPATPDALDVTRLFRFDPLGRDRRLFTDPVTEDEITHLADPLNLPLPIELRWMHDHREQYYGRGKSIFLETSGASLGDPPEPVTEANVRVCNLGDLLDSGGNVIGWAHVPAAGSGEVAIDPVLGRIAFGDAPATEVLASFHYGFAAPIGGGEYERGAAAPRFGTARRVAHGAALAHELSAAPTSGTVEVGDSGRYAAPSAVAVEADKTLVWRAANGAFPLVQGSGDIALQIEGGGTLILDGLLLDGVTLRVPDFGDEEPRHFLLRHCTIVPGSRGGTDAPGLVVEHAFTTVTIEACVLAPVHAVDSVEVTLTDSIIDATSSSLVAFRGPASDLAPGGALNLENVTVVGKLHTRQIDATNALFVSRFDAADSWRGPLWVDRRQAGCLRFCFVPPGARTPRRFECQPAAGADPLMWPAFTSLRYGDPGYGQLLLSTAEAIRRGAEGESEIGAFHMLYQPQREANLRLRLDEYLRFGLEAGVFYIT